MIIGLRRGTVELLEHQDEWMEEGRKCIGLLSSVLGKRAIAIEHVGSTAIRGIHAKPIIDIAVGMHSLDEAMDCREELARHGIIFHGEDNPGQFLFVITNGELRTHHIHFVPYNGEAWRNYIIFRDYLRSHPERAKAYDELKLKLASMYSDNRKAYTASKDSFIRDTITEARKKYLEIASITPIVDEESPEITPEQAARARLAHETHPEWYGKEKMRI